MSDEKRITDPHDPDFGQTPEAAPDALVTSTTPAPPAKGKKWLVPAIAVGVIAAVAIGAMNMLGGSAEAKMLKAMEKTEAALSEQLEVSAYSVLPTMSKLSEKGTVGWDVDFRSAMPAFIPDLGLAGQIVRDVDKKTFSWTNQLNYAGSKALDLNMYYTPERLAIQSPILTDSETYYGVNPKTFSSDVAGSIFDSASGSPYALDAYMISTVQDYFAMIEMSYDLNKHAPALGKDLEKVLLDTFAKAKTKPTTKKAEIDIESGVKELALTTYTFSNAEVKDAVNKAFTTFEKSQFYTDGFLEYMDLSMRLSGEAGDKSFSEQLAAVREDFNNEYTGSLAVDFGIDDKGYWAYSCVTSLDQDGAEVGHWTFSYEPGEGKAPTIALGSVSEYSKSVVVYQAATVDGAMNETIHFGDGEQVTAYITSDWYKDGRLAVVVGGDYQTETKLEGTLAVDKNKSFTLAFADVPMQGAGQLNITCDGDTSTTMSTPEPVLLTTMSEGDFTTLLQTVGETAMNLPMARALIMGSGF